MEIDLGAIKRCVACVIKQFDFAKKELHAKSLKEVVSIVRRSEEIIPPFVDVLFEHLRREDCDVRLAVLFLANYFFQRSHKFRLDWTNSMQDFLVYALETSPLRYPLPKPPEAADLLKRETLAVVRCWISKFGPGYPKLEKLHEFLKNSKSVDWEQARPELLITREREDRKRFLKEVRARKVVEHVTLLYNESRTEIERLLAEGSSVIELLFPQFCALGEQKEKGSRHQTENGDQLHGFGGVNRVNICINVTGIEIEETPENVDLLNQLRETTNQLERWCSKLGKWLKRLTEVGDSTETTRRIINYRHALNEELQKCREFKLKKELTKGKFESDSEDDFLDVEEKDGYELDFDDGEVPPLAHNQQSIGGSEHTNRPSCEKKPAKQSKEEGIKDDEVILDGRPGTSGLCRIGGEEKHNDGKKGPPKLAMGLDLKYWGQSGIRPAEIVRNRTDSHGFWRPADDESVPTEDMEAYTSRQITFVGELPPIRRRCRAPLPSGKLCPRMERDGCALHGPVIDRDEQGFPMQQLNDEEKGQSSTLQEERRESEELEYLRDVEAATGVSLISEKPKNKKATRKKSAKTKGKRKKKTKRTARKRIVPASVKTRDRLKAKLFDKKSLKRITKTLEQIQKVRATRKFSQQFNY